MSHTIQYGMCDARSRATTAPVRRREFLVNLARLAGGVCVSSLCTGSPLLAGARGRFMPSQRQGCQDKQGAGFDTLESRAGYFPTVWPSEHTDLWRSHAVFDEGLPADVAHGDLLVTTANFEFPVWGYTRADNEVFIIGGSPFLLEFFTKTIENGANSSPTALDLQSELLRTARFVPYVARVDTRTMSVGRFEMRLGHTLNYTGGLLMHRNGFVYAVAQSVLYKIDPRTMTAVESRQLPLVGTTPAQSFSTTYNGMQVLADGQLVLKGFPFFDNTISGRLLLIDPDDLRINVEKSTLVSSARLTLQQSCNGPTYLYTVNATESLRYQITDTDFIVDDAWTRNYLVSGNTVASSPLLYGRIGQVAFADNTAPGATNPIHLFAQPVDVDDLPPAPSLTPVPAFKNQVPGFNFFMVAGDPFSRQMLVYYDPINRLLSAHRVHRDGRLQMLWERDGYAASASPALVPDRDLLYIDNWQDGHDHLAVLRLSTGAELASVPLQAKQPTIGTIFVGMNNDVFIVSSEASGTSGLISRIRCPSGGNPNTQEDA